LGAPRRLTVLIEGESLLTDATAIVVFKLLLGFASVGAAAGAAPGAALAQFLSVFLGGALLGVGWGGLAGWLAVRLRCGAQAVLMLTLVTAYAGFIMAEEALRVSGVMAVVGAALTFGAYALPRLSREETAALRDTWEFLALACNTLLFVLIGLSLQPGALFGHAAGIVPAVPLLRELPLSVRRQLERRLQPMNFLHGDVVVAEGEHGDALFLIVRGVLEVSRRGGRDGARQVLNRLGPGDFFGEIALLEDQVRSATVTAQEPVTVLRLARREFIALMGRDPELARQVDLVRRRRHGATDQP
jgi:hypothetical protein